jgi:hypothetical protein
MADWLPFARKLQVTYNRQQMPPGTPILGAVLHTTDAGGVQTLERFQRDWQAKQDQTAHFMVDRAGNIGQFRALNEVAWHFRRYLSTQYIGIEHIAQYDKDQERAESLEPAQIEKSARLLVELTKLLGFPIQPLAKAGEKGVGVHAQFEGTKCGNGVLRKRGPFQSPDQSFEQDYFKILVRAADLLQRQRQGPPGYERDYPRATAGPVWSPWPGWPSFP